MIPKVSVIIPLFNKAETIARSIHSVIAQTLTDIEIIIVDDGCTDDSMSRVRNFDDPRLRIIQQENAGPGSARNTGAQLAKATLLTFLDADDEWAPDFLSTGATALQQNPQAALYLAGMVVGPARTIPQPNPAQCGLRPGLQEVCNPGSGALLKSAVDQFDSCCTIVRGDIFWEHGGFYDRGRCLYGEDSYLWAQLYLTHPFYFDPEPRVWLDTDASNLGFSRLGRHPIRPALLDPDPLFACCRTPNQKRLMAELLAYYRFLETEKNKALRTGSISDLRREFPWPTGVPGDLRRREAKVSLRALAERFGIVRRYP